jgi:hypothetical protein
VAQPNVWVLEDFFYNHVQTFLINIFYSHRRPHIFEPRSSTHTFSNGHTIESGGLKAYRRRNIDELNIHLWARGNILQGFTQIVIGFISYIMWIAILPHFILCSLCIILRSGYRLHISCPNGGKYRAMLYVWCERIIESTSEDEEELKHPPQPSLLASKFWDHVLQSCVTATPEQTLHIFSLLHRCFFKRQVILQRPRIMDAFAGSSSLTKDSRRISTGEYGMSSLHVESGSN